MTPKFILCPGQGAQTVGMGKAWFDASPEARAVFHAADKALGDRLGGRLSEMCFGGPAERLNQTDVSQPAIYAASVACWRGLLAVWGTKGANGGAIAGANVLATAGLSLGEYTALHLAGAFSFEDGLELVALRGRAMQDAADALRLADGTPGSGMVALIGADEAQAQQLCNQVRGSDVLVPANFNAPGQIVISGSIAACRRAAEAAGAMGLRATALAVAGAFHSPLMQPAADTLASALKGTKIQPPICPVASNVTGGVHGVDGELGGLSVADSIRRRLVEQLTMPVRWAQNCEFVTTTYPAEAHELAPGKTLAGLMRRINKAVKVETHDEP